MERKYQGIVTDRLGTLETRKTKLYATYKEAHDAAEKLCKKTMGDRGTIDVESITRAEEIAQALQESGTWDIALLKELCTLADMESEWQAADGETFEDVAYAAAEKLGVEI